MKVTKIGKVLEMALKVKRNGGNFIPCFRGESGIGKTEMVYQFSEGEKLPVKTLIVSQLDANDFVGLLYRKTKEDGREYSCYALPDFWPTSGQGILFLDEVNRGKKDVRAPLLQLLHEGRIHDYVFPKGWMIVSAINPDSEAYSVSTLDTAMTSRLEIIDVDFDMQGFIEHMEASGYHQQIQDFIRSGAWTYLRTDQISSDANAKYVCPRTFKRLSDLKIANENELKENPILHREMVCNILGGNIGEAFHKFCFEEAPILIKDILDNKKEAFKRLKKYSSPEKYRGDLISATVKSVVDNFSGTDIANGKANMDLMLEIAGAINADQAVSMIRECMLSSANNLSLDEYIELVKKKSPTLVKALAENLKVNQKKEEQATA